MTSLNWIILLCCVWLVVGVVCFVIGHRIGRTGSGLEIGGRLIFENYVNEKDEPATHVIFQLDSDFEELEKMHYILLEIRRENK